MYELKTPAVMSGVDLFAQTSNLFASCEIFLLMILEPHQPHGRHTQQYGKNRVHVLKSIDIESYILHHYEDSTRYLLPGTPKHWVAYCM